jgi:hypothetical protein
MVVRVVVKRPGANVLGVIAVGPMFEREQCGLEVMLAEEVSRCPDRLDRHDQGQERRAHKPLVESARGTGCRSHRLRVYHRRVRGGKTVAPDPAAFFVDKPPAALESEGPATELAEGTDFWDSGPPCAPWL